MARSHVRRGRPGAVRSTAFAVLAALGVLTTTVSATAAPTPATTPPAARTAGTATFGIGPANAKGLDGRPYLNFLVQPGSVVTDHAEVLNLATSPVTLNVYVAGAEVSADGRFGYQPRAADRTDAASWMTLGRPVRAGRITLAARSRAVIPISVAIPHDADPGDYAAGVITSVTSKVTTTNGANPNLEQRVALRTFIRVGGALRPALSVENLTAHYRGTSNPVGGGSATVSYTVRNTGNVRLGAHQRVVVSGILGADTPARALADVPLLLPKSSIRMSVRIPDVLPQFHLTARVTLYPLVVPGDADPGTPKQITASAGFWAVPWVLIGVLVVLLAAGFGLWLWRRRRARRPQTPPSGRHRPGGGPSGGPKGPDTNNSPSSPLTEGVPA